MRRFVGLLVSGVMLATPAYAQSAGRRASECAPGNAGLKLPAGFCATIFADSVTGARHMAIAPNGDVYVSTMQGRAGGGGIVALRDSHHVGHADVREQFSTGYSTSEVALYDGYLYTEAFTRGGRGAPSVIAILRYPFKEGDLKPTGAPDTVVQDLPGAPGHTTRNFFITSDGTMYVNVGSPSNSCQTKDRAGTAPGKEPCEELDTRAGIWRFDARKLHQTEQTGEHFARGIRNAVGVAINPNDNRLWTTQHGRDQLSDFRTALHLDSAQAVEYNAENPAEELLQVNRGDDFGWPYCYYAVPEKHLVLAPEYGGNGKTTGQCAQKKEPVAVFPAHYAPNALLFYSGSTFPARYKHGAFIAFHGSWNRAPEPRKGFNVVFQPLDGEKAAGPYEVFADGFATNTEAMRTSPVPGNHRPTGLAQGPDGALYVADDAGGRIWKIIYVGK